LVRRGSPSQAVGRGRPNKMAVMSQLQPMKNRFAREGLIPDKEMLSWKDAGTMLQV